MFDDAAEKNEVVALFLCLLGEGNDPRQDARDLDDGQIGIEALPPQGGR